jgi:hypothetical protein
MSAFVLLISLIISMILFFSKKMFQSPEFGRSFQRGPGIGRSRLASPDIAEPGAERVNAGRAGWMNARR